MAEQNREIKGRPVGGTEHSWCKAVAGGTGTTVLALLFSKPLDLSLLEIALQKLQYTHPILSSKLHLDAATNTFSYITPPTPRPQIQPFDLPLTAQILQSLSSPHHTSLSPLHLILEHELNRNPWRHPDHSLDTDTDTDVFFASVYSLSDDKSVVALRLHTSVCDITSAAALLRELLGTMGRRGEEGEGLEEEIGNVGELSLGIEDCIPSCKANKPFWVRGVDMLGYSLNSFRFTNLKFEDIDSPRSSQTVRLQLDYEQTDGLLSACKSRGLKLCGALAAAALIAVRVSKCLPDDQWEKYAVVILTDCRSMLDPALTSHHVGFYHSAILNTHDIRGSEMLWELAKRIYTSFENAKSNNKHFTDMADLNFLMCKAIDNPGLTPSSSLRTSLVSVFEEPVIDLSIESRQDMGVEDYMGCASVHGVGPSIAFFDTVRDGQLDSLCVYPSPLHSREQIQELVDEMKKVLVEVGTGVENER